MRKRITIILIATVCLIAGALVFLFLSKDKPSAETTAYETICSKGYTGTEETLLASLAGETVVEDESEMAYTLATEKGYSGTFEEWMKTLTGIMTTDKTKSAYSLATDSGYSGTLAEWLTSFSKDPDSLGKSANPEQKTDYELACEYGFNGTYTEWLVSLISK